MTFLPSRLHDIRRARNQRRYPPSHYDSPQPKPWWRYEPSSIVPRPIGSLRQLVRNLQFATWRWLEDSQVRRTGAFELEGGQRYTSWYRLDRRGNITIVTNPWPFGTGALAVARPQLVASARRCSECPRALT